MKFYALIVASDLTLKRMWIDNEMAATLLKERNDIKVYRQSEYLEAVLQEDGSILWKDVPTVEKL